MNMKSEKDAQELNEQDLEQVSGAGADSGFLCTCGCTEYDMKREYTPFGMRRYRECKNCHSKYIQGVQKLS